MECHRCPFGTFAPENLQTALMSMYSVGSQDMGKLLHLIKGQHYHVACTRVWEISHDVKKGLRHSTGLIERRAHLFLDVLI